jgi:membrane protein YdbS with pleckstrin-like domain
MNPNWKKYLSENEKIVFEFSLAKKYLAFLRFQWMGYSFLLLFVSLFCFKSKIWFLKILGYLFLFISFLFFIISLWVPWYLKKSNQFALTNKRFLAKRGWLNVNLVSIPYSKITDISASQSFWERNLFNCGKISVDTAGSPGPELVLEKIENPFLIKAKIDEISSSKENGGD